MGFENKEVDMVGASVLEVAPKGFAVEVVVAAGANGDAGVGAKREGVVDAVALNRDGVAEDANGLGGVVVDAVADGVPKVDVNGDGLVVPPSDNEGAVVPPNGLAGVVVLVLPPNVKGVDVDVVLVLMDKEGAPPNVGAVLVAPPNGEVVVLSEGVANVLPPNPPKVGALAVVAPKPRRL